MGIFKIQKELVEFTSLQTHPSSSFSSGTMDVPTEESVLTNVNNFSRGVTGSLNLVPRPSPVFKDFPQGIFVTLETAAPGGGIISTEPFTETEEFIGVSPYSFADFIKNSFTDGIIPEGSNISGSMYKYVGMHTGELAVGPMSPDAGYTPIGVVPAAEPGVVNSRRQPARNRKKKEVKLYRPPYRYEYLGTRPVDPSEAPEIQADAGTIINNLSGSNRAVKDLIRKVLMPDKALDYTDSQFAYKNYHTLNFFTGDGFPDAACLIYNNATGAIPPMSAPFGLDHPVIKSGWDKLPTTWEAEQLLYREPTPETTPGLRAGRGPYTPTGSFTFEFYINPRYTNEHTGDVSDGVFLTTPFNAGTIMHMPTVFAISLVSGSSVDPSGLVDGYRIALQLSHSAGITPSNIIFEDNSNIVTCSQRPQYRDNLIFTSDDNSLKRNHWHYVGIRWGTERTNHGTGSIIIDGVERGTFYVPSMSIAPQLPLINTHKTVGATPTQPLPGQGLFSVARTAGSIAYGDASPSATNQPGVPDPDAMIVGNFYEGPGTGSLCPEKDSLFNFFNLTSSINEGTRPVIHARAVGTAARILPSHFNTGQTAGSDPTDFQFKHQLNAEIHEIKIYDKYRGLEDIITGSIEGPGTVLAYSQSNTYSTSTPEDGHLGLKTGKGHRFNSITADKNLLFYLPPFFVKESPNRSFLLNCVESFKKDFDASAGFGYSILGTYIAPGEPLYNSPGAHGFSAPTGIGTLHGPGITADPERMPFELIHPDNNTVLYYNTGAMLNRPFNAGLSLNTDATIINLENFCREFVGGEPLASKTSFVANPFNYKPGNYPRLMQLTASSVSQKFTGSFSRYGLNIGRLNSIRVEVQEGEYTSYGDYPFTGKKASYDGKFLTHVSSSLDHLYATGSIVRRNLALMPNDNGRFAPNFGWLLSGSINTEMDESPADAKALKAVARPSRASAMSNFVDDLGNLDLTLIGLQNLLDNKPALKKNLTNYDINTGWERKATTSYLTGSPNFNIPDIGLSELQSPTRFTESDQFTDIVSPDNPDGWAHCHIMNGPLGEAERPGTYVDKLGNDCPASYDFWIYQTTGDPSSNEIKIIDVSNLFYGQRIEPGTFRLRDPFYTGSNGKISMTLRDDGHGGLYRADCLTEQAKWANVGNIFYDHGLGIVKSPHIAHFGKDYFDCDFAGMQNVHIMTVNAFAPASQVNSSSNPGYLPLSATLNANDNAPEFTYITSINLHDENLNVIMRANLAQPVLKRWVDEYLFKVKMDF